MNPKLKQLQVIHLALCTGIFIFAAVTSFINREKFYFDANPANTAPFNPIFPIVGLISISVSMIAFRNLISKIDKTAPLDSKITQYQTAFIMSAALLEGGALFNLVGSFISHNAFFLIFAAANLIFLIRNRPTKDKLISTLQLQHQDTEIL
jgi:F0F1-type ATP synthase membrane subunit c/vacuolar-type H+-ATPase subunit K